MRMHADIDTLAFVAMDTPSPLLSSLPACLPVQLAITRSMPNLFLFDAERCNSPKTPLKPRVARAACRHRIHQLGFFRAPPFCCHSSTFSALRECVLEQCRVEFGGQACEVAGR
jgi:hypothetical protein